MCIFVNDNASRPVRYVFFPPLPSSSHFPLQVLQQLAKGGVQLILLRCTGSNHLDLSAAAEVNITVSCVVRSVLPFAEYDLMHH